MPLRWDAYSDQPDIIRDKAYKKSIYRRVIWDSIKLLLTNVIVAPLIAAGYFFLRPNQQRVALDQFFGLGINLDKRPQDTRALVDELGVETLLIRMPLHDVENVEAYVRFAQQYQDKTLVINILQDRRHVEDLVLLRQSLNLIFARFAPITQRFQIGNAINRKKWAIFSMDEYLRFYGVAYRLRQEQYPDLMLLGSSVIDFEYYFTVRTLFNFSKVRYDQFSTLLYVDRRGAPENTQLGMGVMAKLQLLQTIVRLSHRTAGGASPEIIISEANWPIQNTRPYAPTSETECVSLEDYANYLVRYYLLVLASGVVSTIYWHQLIAPGYGLIDHRENHLVKYPAYYAFKTMLGCLRGCEFVDFKQNDTLYQMQFKAEDRHVEVAWSLRPLMFDVAGYTVLTRDGVEDLVRCDGNETIELGESPVYLIKA